MGVIAAGLATQPTQRHQRKNAIDTERRALEKAATDKAIKVLAELLQLDPPTYL